MTKKEKADKHFKLDSAVLQPLRMASFKFNGELSVRPEMLELQNYLEETNLYKEYYLERSYARLSQLGVFQTIKPVIQEISGTNLIDVHYYLVPACTMQ
jgi:outer membrane protein assembly factor BamA